MRTYLVYSVSLFTHRETLRIEGGEHVGPVPSVGSIVNIGTERYSVRAVEWDVFPDPGPHNPAPPDHYPQQCVTVVLKRIPTR